MGAVAVVALTAAYLFGGWLGSRQAIGITGRDGRAAEGDRAPAYTAVSLEGDSVTLEALRPDPVLLNIWATWCVPCIREMPGLDSLHREYAPRGLHVLGVSIDDPGSGEAIERFLSDRGIGYPVFHDPAQEVNRVFLTFGVPETFLIDRRGRIVRHWPGMIEAGSAAVRDEIEAVLPGGG